MLLGLSVYKHNVLRGYLVLFPLFLRKKFVTSICSLGLPETAQVESDSILESGRIKNKFNSHFTASNQSITRNTELNKMLADISCLKGTDKVHKFKFYYLVNCLLKHPENNLLSDAILCNLLEKSFQFENMPLSSYIIEWSILHNIEFRLSLVLDIVSKFKSADPYLAYKIFRHSFSNYDFTLTSEELERWVLEYIQHLGWEAQFTFYDLVYQKHDIELFSLKIYRIFLNSITRIFSKAKKPAQLPQSADVLISHAQIKFKGNDEITNQILRLKAPIENSIWSVQFIESMQSNSIKLEYESTSLLCYIFVLRSDLAMIENLLKISTLPSKTFKFTTLDATLKGFLDAGKLKDAKKLFYKNLHSSTQPSLISFSNMIGALCKNHEMDEALELLLNMDQLSISLTPFIGHCIISGFIKIMDLESGFEFFEEMVKLEIKPDISTIETLLKGASKLELWHLVFKIYYFSLRKGCFTFTPSIFESIATAQIETKDTDGLNHTIRELTFFLTSPEAQFFSEVDYFSLMEFLCTHRKVNEMQLIFNHLLKFYHIQSPEPFNIILKNHEFNQNVERAIDIYTMMKSLNIIPNSNTFQTMLNLYSSKGNLEEAVKWQGKIFSKGFNIPLSTSIILTKLHLNNGQPEHAIELFKKHLIDSNVNSELLELAIQAQIQIKKVDYLNESIKFICDSKITPTYSSLELIIQEALIVCQDFDVACKVQGIFKKNKITESINIWNNFILYYLNKGQVDEAVNIFKVELKNKDIEPDVITLSHFILYYTSSNNLEMTKKWTDTMLQLAILPTTDLCNKILEQYIYDTNYNTAFEFFDTMVWCQVPCNRLTTEIMSKFFVSHGRYEELISFLESLDRNPRLRPNFHLLDTIVNSLNTSTPSFFLTQLNKTAIRLNWSLSENFKNKLSH